MVYFHSFTIFFLLKLNYSWGPALLLLRHKHMPNSRIMSISCYYFFRNFKNSIFILIRTPIYDSYCYVKYLYVCLQLNWFDKFNFVYFYKRPQVVYFEPRVGSLICKLKYNNTAASWATRVGYRAVCWIPRVGPGVGCELGIYRYSAIRSVALK